ncbi:MAG: hypothetical protein MMC23_005890 [Stictis urceolatum]|nr:hypothetical protein [Stictis urceolata]
MEAARALAKTFYENNIKLVYGGGSVGLMGEVAKTLVSLSGPDSVSGIIPEALVKYEQAGRDSGVPKDTGVDENIFGRMTVVADMHTRKRQMAKEVMSGGPGSGFVALPGGYGTLEELMEMTTWHQLGIHKVGVCVFNVGGFYDGLLEWVNKACGEGFIQRGNEGIIAEARNADEVVKALREYKVAEGSFKLDWEEQ